jgi:hypothetical protein
MWAHLPHASAALVEGGDAGRSGSAHHEVDTERGVQEGPVQRPPAGHDAGHAGARAEHHIAVSRLEWGDAESAGLGVHALHAQFKAATTRAEFHAIAMEAAQRSQLAGLDDTVVTAYTILADLAWRAYAQHPSASDPSSVRRALE